MKFYNVEYQVEDVEYLDADTYTKSNEEEFKRFELLSDDLFENNEKVLQEICKKNSWCRSYVCNSCFGEKYSRSSIMLA